MEKTFDFAGFTFPRPVGMLPRGTLAKRLKQSKEPKYASGYFMQPTPILGGTHPGAFFYLDSDFMPGLRWQWAEDVKDARIRHSGWYSDEDGVGELIRGIVLRLPHGRGFLAGWSMGEGMASFVEGDIYDDLVEAARAADSIAESTAERERECQAKEREREESEEREREIEEEAEEERLRPLRQCLVGCIYK